MTVESLTVRHVRIISHAEICPSPTVNLIVGPNAAGKTSVIEAIDILFRGRSFRTNRLDHIMSTGARELLVAARLRKSCGTSLVVGLEKSRMSTHMRIQGRDADSIGELASLLPVQVLHPESHQLIIGGPAHRRAFIDWGAFHVERDFGSVWRRYRRGLRQRNAALRSAAAITSAQAWHDELAETGCAIDRRRRRYLSDALSIVKRYCLDLLKIPVELAYRPGWPESEDLRALLDRELKRDAERGHTRFGPHRAELQISLDGRPASAAASRGQQKLLATALKLGQARDLSTRQHRPSLFLIDDLPAELELQYREKILRSLAELGAQVFITAIRHADVDLSAWATPQVFHVEQGHVQKVI